KDLVAQGLQETKVERACRAHLKYAGSDFSLTVPLSDPDSMTIEFTRLHQARYGFVMEGSPIIVETLEVECTAKLHGDRLVDAKALSTAAGWNAASERPAANATVSMYINDRWQNVPVFNRAQLKAGWSIVGPAMIIDSTATTIVESSWKARIDQNAMLFLEYTEPADDEQADTVSLSKPDPVKLELFNHLFMAVAEQMGLTLQNTSRSVNIKERLDFSCAVFDGKGSLVANAPHIPVHLGSMGESVKQIMQNRKDTMRAGDAYVLNNPYKGGTHLPDITVISPVFDGDRSQPIFYVASRGHHADVGGITPGSMPSESKDLFEEGVVIDDFQLVTEGRFKEDEMRALLLSARFPARNVDQNLADLKAQVAANRMGENELLRLSSYYGREQVTAYMRYVQKNAEAMVRAAIGNLQGGQFVCKLDEGHEIHVAVKVNGPEEKLAAEIDFSETSSQTRDNLNAPLSVCRAAVMYVFRTLIDDDIPLNDGCLVPLRLTVPDGSLLNPQYPAAVVAGNVETSQQITDALYGALSVMAASQGTMNNFSFGNDRYQYYETIAGG
ncbi:MAG TPA: hydantoinase B/oxoprolinase family protein, partial [Chroococcales cyanobacterium]